MAGSSRRFVQIAQLVLWGSWRLGGARSRCDHLCSARGSNVRVSGSWALKTPISTDSKMQVASTERTAVCTGSTWFGSTSMADPVVWRPCSTTRA